MTKAQRRILIVMTVICVVVNSCALFTGWWCARDLEKRGVSIEEILSK